MSGQDAHFMDRALKQAELAVSRGQTPFGAVVVDRDGRVIGEGHNTVRADLDPTAHGEVVAIRDAWRRVGTWQQLAGCTLYTSCEPCLLCSFVITQIGFSRVVFAARGTDVPGHKPLLGGGLTKAAAWVNTQPDWPPLEVVGDFLRERALDIIAAFPWTHTQARANVATQAPARDACVVHEVFAYLCVRGAAAAIDFYTRVFGAEEILRFVGPDGRTAHAELKLGPATLMLADEFPEYGVRSPLALGGTGTTLHLHVDNVDILAARAVEAGATMLRDPADQDHGERQCRVRDPFGHEWLLGHPIGGTRADQR